MEATMELTKNPNILVAKKSTKEKLKEWYKKNFARTKENDVVRKILKTAGEIYSTGMEVAISIFCPEYSALAPIAKVQKEVGLKAYDGIKSAVDQAAGVELKEDNTESTSYLSEEETKAIAEASVAALDKLNKNIDKKSKTSNNEKKDETSISELEDIKEESKGRSR